ncbi:SAGA complex ubiquitin carboxy terminal hydrolase Ubp8 [Schizosaccharomyces japonicus yFS275]|uniref:Ubiquitin carboxyl-terminal hydrolase n=1 Tax=Schizosaccharomyces japonicus (strain yFS275 / FY16936) TaxID=402676 RepID=B6K2V2_SCHJY|nr:SAGA complex ubiquitin carboxy terminal hydrolase Ubp8 [Schizosaccharomyces japonicus yFS275]EEB08592.1 SAGA complex ubiquitin carboxy terminal hydrolase Ubp8 [Schizosaccharomyces japonicus yFS275]
MSCPHLSQLPNLADTFWEACQRIWANGNTVCISCEDCGAISKRSVQCLHCKHVGCLWAEDGKGHYQNTQHKLVVDMKNAYIYCFACEDYVYDRDLERLRSNCKSLEAWKLDVGSASPEEERLMPVKKGTDLLFKDACITAGLRGMQNMGATCFMSVILQSILHNPTLRNLFLSGYHTSSFCKKSSCMACAVDDMFSVVYGRLDKASFFGPTTILSLMWNISRDLCGYSQQDGHEFLVYLLNQLHVDMGGTNNSDCDCVIHKVFGGTMYSTVTCLKCKTKKRTMDPMVDINLDIKESTLEGCLKSFVAPEAVHYRCSSCNGLDATKQLQFHKLSPTLSIQLKRFRNESSTNSCKIEKYVSFPLRLSLETSSERSKVDYGLFSVVCHKGTLDTGHYIVYILYENQWFQLDDTTITEVSEKQVLQAEAYLLFYHERRLFYEKSK